MAGTKRFNGACKKIISMLEKAAGKQLRGGLCDAEQVVFNEAVALAAEKLIAKEDAQAVLDSATVEYDAALLVAMNAYDILQECLNPE